MICFHLFGNLIAKKSTRGPCQVFKSATPSPQRQLTTAASNRSATSFGTWAVTPPRPPGPSCAAGKEGESSQWPISRKPGHLNLDARSTNACPSATCVPGQCCEYSCFRLVFVRGVRTSNVEGNPVNCGGSGGSPPACKPLARPRNEAVSQLPTGSCENFGQWRLPGTAQPFGDYSTLHAIDCHSQKL